MFTTNQRCNPLASIMGMFFHSTSTPELVVEVFAHSGLSVSLTAIHKMIDSLSKSAGEKLRALARTKVLGFAWDNVDIDFKSWQPVVEKPGTTLKHATSALAFPLEHGVTAEDLRCSETLWASDPLNPNIPPSQHRPTRTWM